MFRKMSKSKSGNGGRVVDLSTFYIVKVFNFHSVQLLHNILCKRYNET